MIKKKILYITWEGPSTQYLESLMFPLFKKLTALNGEYQFHCIQFSWNKNFEEMQLAARNYGIIYSGIDVGAKSNSFRKIVSLIKLFSKHRLIKNYVKKNEIDAIIVRSIFPAILVLKTGLKTPLIYEADGLAILEKTEFTSLGMNNPVIKYLKLKEKEISKKADLILTRSQYGANYLKKEYGIENEEKFRIFYNGRDSDRFYFDRILRKQTRKDLGISEKTVFIYIGSLGLKYALKEMISIFREFRKKHVNSYFILLTGCEEIARNEIPSDLCEYVLFKKVEPAEVNKYLNAADIGFVLIYPTESMKAVSPVKLGEYMLTGLPCIVSERIGDTEELVKGLDYVHIFRHEEFQNINKAVNFAYTFKNYMYREIIAEKNLTNFSIKGTSLIFNEALQQVLNIKNYDKT